MKVCIQGILSIFKCSGHSSISVVSLRSTLQHGLLSVLHLKKNIYGLRRFYLFWLKHDL